MSKSHSHLDTLKADLAGGRISRREFVRYAALLGMSAGAAMPSSFMRLRASVVR